VARSGSIESEIEIVFGTLDLLRTLLKSLGGKVIFACCSSSFDSSVSACERAAVVAAIWLSCLALRGVAVPLLLTEWASTDVVVAQLVTADILAGVWADAARPGIGTCDSTALNLVNLAMSLE
jgi:hypothetical protein